MINIGRWSPTLSAIHVHHPHSGRYVRFGFRGNRHNPRMIRVYG